MTIRAEPMARGARAAEAEPSLASTTVWPTVKTRKKVPISSTRYLRGSMMRRLEVCLRRSPSIRSAGAPRARRTFDACGGLERADLGVGPAWNWFDQDRGD